MARNIYLRSSKSLAVDVTCTLRRTEMYTSAEVMVGTVVKPAAIGVIMRRRKASSNAAKGRRGAEANRPAAAVPTRLLLTPMPGRPESSLVASGSQTRVPRRMPEM